MQETIHLAIRDGSCRTWVLITIVDKELTGRSRGFGSLQVEFLSFRHLKCVGSPWPCLHEDIHKKKQKKQASLRRKELEREQIEKNRELHIRQEEKQWLALTSIYSTRSYERPWVSGMITRQASAVGNSQGRWNANTKPLVKRPVPKLPSIASFTDSKKCNQTSISNKIGNAGLGFNIGNPEPQIISKRKRLHQRILPRRAGLQSVLESQAINVQTISVPAKTQGAPVPGDGRVQAENRSAYGSKSSAPLSQLKRCTKASGGDGRSRGSLMQAHHSPAPSSSTSPRGAHGYSPIQHRRPSFASGNSSGASGLSLSQLDGPPHSSPSSSRDIGSSLHQLSRPSNAPSVSSAANGTSLSQQSRPSQAPPSSSGANGTSSSQYSQAPLSSIPSRASPFRFPEEDLYGPLSTVVEHVDAEDDHSLEEDYLSDGVRTPFPTLNENGSVSQTSSPHINTSDPREEFQIVRNASRRQVELPFGSSAQVCVVHTSEDPRHCIFSEDQASVNGEDERSRCDPRNDGPERNHNVVSPADTLGRFNCAESPTASIRNRRLQVNENSPRLHADALYPTRRTTHSEVQHSRFNSPWWSGPPPQRPVSPTTRSINTSSEDLVTNGSSRINASRSPLFPIRRMHLFTDIGNHDPLLDGSMASEPGSMGLGISRGRRSASPSPNAGQDVLEEYSSNHAPDSSEASYLQSTQENLTHDRSTRGSLQESLPFALLAMSSLHQQTGVMPRMPRLPTAAVKETTKPKADLEKLQRLKESLLEEDSEEEGDLCRICLIPGGTVDNPLLEPCQCVGSLQFVHKECLNRWLKAKITSGAELEAVKTCELCRQRLDCNLSDFDMEDYYSTHQQSQGQSELMDSGLYLMLLLHLYEQRYAELLRLTHSRSRRDLLFRNYQQLRAEENENSESGDYEDESGQRSPSSIA